MAGASGFGCSRTDCDRVRELELEHVGRNVSFHAEDNHDWPSYSAYRCQGFHALLVCPGHEHDFEVLRIMCPILAAGQGTGDCGQWRDRDARHDHADRWLYPGHVEWPP